MDRWVGRRLTPSAATISREFDLVHGARTRFSCAQSTRAWKILRRECDSFRVVVVVLEMSIVEFSALLDGGSWVEAFVDGGVYGKSG